MTKAIDDKEELQAYGSLVKKHMAELESFGDIAAHIETTFEDQNGKEWTVRTYLGEPNDED